MVFDVYVYVFLINHLLVVLVSFLTFIHVFDELIVYFNVVRMILNDFFVTYDLLIVGFFISDVLLIIKRLGCFVMYGSFG